MKSFEPRVIAHFEVMARLGEGGMGIVYRARDRKLDREVAIKVVPMPDTDNAEYRARFLREAKVAALVSHPAFPVVYEIGEIDGASFIAMELLSGRTLRAALPITLDEALRVTTKVAEALAAAHDAGITHRDIKPENIFLTGGGAVKVLDFGIARREPRSVVGNETMNTGELVSREGEIIGTPGYMAPEQAMGRRAGPPADIFALGILLYELIAHEPPFSMRSLIESAVSVIHDEPPPLRTRAAVSNELHELVHRCLEKEPDRRPRDCESIARELREILAANNAGGEAATLISKVPAAIPSTASEVPGRRQRGVLPLSLAFLGLAAGAGYLVHAGRQPAPTPAVVSASPQASPRAMTDLPITGTTNEAARSAYASAMANLRGAFWQGAQTRLREALEADPEFVLAAMRLSHLEGVGGKVTDARQRLHWVAERATQLSERDRAWLSGIEAMHVYEPPDFKLAARRFEAAAARWPDDAELHLMTASMYQRSAALDDALPQARLALELDPEYADALQLLARIAVLQGNRDQAVELLDRCVDTRGTDCLYERMRYRAFHGDCAGTIADAKLFDARGGGGVRHWVFAASAVLAQGDSVDDVERFLLEAERDADSDASRRVVRLSRVKLDILRGKLHVAEASLDAEAERVGGLNDLADITSMAVRLALERGDLTRYRSIAERYLTRRHSAQVSASQRPNRDPSPILWKQLLGGRPEGEAELSEKLTRWRETQRSLGFSEGPIWFQSEASLASSPAEAKEALARKPPRFLAEQVQNTDLGWDTLGNVLLLAGDVVGAREALGQATRACTVLVFPIEHIDAWALAGDAESKESRCAYYKKVVSHWGETTPEPNIVKRVRSQLRTLECR